jgi:NADPH2:quinone reductase
MKAILLDDYGPVDNLRVGEVPEPVPGPGDVVVRVAYAGLRWGDVMSRNGVPRRFHTPPFVPGQEATGVVHAVGEGVTEFSVGDRVMALALGGAYAEMLKVPTQTLIRVPDHVGLASMLAYGINFPTAWLACTTWGGVSAGDVVLLHAAAGGVGRLALQILTRRMGARVIAVVGSDAKAALCRDEGAELALDRHEVDYVEAVTAHCGQVDVALNGVAGPTLGCDHRVIRPRGTWVIYGTAGGAGVLPVWDFAYSSITVKPFSILSFLGTPEHQDAQDALWQWLEREPAIEPTVRPLDDVAAAQADMEAGRTTGKVVFAVDT